MPSTIIPLPAMPLPTACSLTSCEVKMAGEIAQTLCQSLACPRHEPRRMGQPIDTFILCRDTDLDDGEVHPMPRKLRVNSPGAIYRVPSHGDRRPTPAGTGQTGKGGPAAAEDAMAGAMRYGPSAFRDLQGGQPQPSPRDEKPSGERGQFPLNPGRTLRKPCARNEPIYGLTHFTNPPAANHPAPFKHFYATPDPNQTNIYLEWQNIGVVPAVKDYCPKQHDKLSINMEDIAFRSNYEVVIGLRSPLADRASGNALYLRVTNVQQFLPTNAQRWLTQLPAQGIVGLQQLCLSNQGICGIKWCPQLPIGANPSGRYLIVGGPALNETLDQEPSCQLFSLWSWTGNAEDAAVQVISDLRNYAIRPEAIDIVMINNEWRIMFVEDRSHGLAYSARNAIHWPINILGNVQ